jgi:hypothetical protein
MTNAENFPYETRLNILYRPLEVVDEQALADASTFKWYNQTLCQVNGSVVRLGVYRVSTTGTSMMTTTNSST